MLQPVAARLLRPLSARDPSEHDRTVSPLELLTDLCFVVAIAQAAASFHHEISDGHAAQGAMYFTMAFFAIFLAWLNFTWFASAYDNDDVAYRLLTMVQIAGSLVIAAGVPQMFEDDFALVVVGYVIMRVALVIQWLRAARHDPERRMTAMRYARAIVVIQVGWALFLFVPHSAMFAVFVALAICETLVPAWAERTGRTTWHPHHVAERYGLFFIIVLGETILSSTIAIQEALDGGEPLDSLFSVIAGGLLSVFGLWWLYFARDDAELLSHRRNATLMLWGFGHYFIFAATAALGAGLAARVDLYAHHSESSSVVSAATVTIPIAVVLAALYGLRMRQHDRTSRTALSFLAAIVLVIAATFTGAPEFYAGVVCAVLVTLEVLWPESALGRQYAPPQDVSPATVALSPQGPPDS